MILSLFSRQLNEPLVDVHSHLELRRLQRNAVDPDAIERLIALIEHEQGYPLYAAVGHLKRALSDAESAQFQFDGGGLEIDVELKRAAFEG